MTFTNRDRLRRKLRAIPLAVRKALKAQNAVNAGEMVETVKGFMSGFEDPTGALKGSVKHQDVSDSTRISQRVEEGGAAAPHALHVEQGTVHAPAYPHFWPAWRLKRRRFKSRMSRAAKKAIQGAIT